MGGGGVRAGHAVARDLTGQEPALPGHGPACLAAFGAMVALARRTAEGRSHLVRVSLARTARWLGGLGRIEGPAAPDPTLAHVDDRLQDSDTPFGRLHHVAPAAELSDARILGASLRSPRHARRRLAGRSPLIGGPLDWLRPRPDNSP